MIKLAIEQFKYLSELIQRQLSSVELTNQAKKLFKAFYLRLQKYTTENSIITEPECNRRLEMLKSLLPTNFIYFVSFISSFSVIF